MDHPTGDTLDGKLRRLHELIDGYRRVAVAYSGGVDSALVLATARARLGDEVVALTAVSPSLPRAELEAARSLAARIGARHVTLSSDEVDDPRYRENTPLRCYFCKSEVYAVLARWAREHRYEVLMDGTNLDDTRDPRPGRKAAREHGVVAPLLDAGLDKAEVRELARRAGLGNWDKPAMACLSSRVPYGTAVTPELLQRIEAAEAALDRCGFGAVRVRHHGSIARLELDPAEFPRVVTARDEIVRCLREVGYTYVALDLAGYRSGSLNEEPTEERGLAFHPE